MNKTQIFILKYNQTIIHDIIKYLEYYEILLFRLMNKNIKSYIESSNQNEHPIFKEMIKFSKNFFFDKLGFNKLYLKSFTSIIVLDIVSLESKLVSIEILKVVPNKHFVKVLMLPIVLYDLDESSHDYFKTLLLYTNINELTIKRLHFHILNMNTFNKLSYDMLISHVTSSVLSLKKLSLNGIIHLKGHFLNSLLTIQMIDLRESTWITLNDMGIFIENNKSSLKHIKIDGENTSKEAFIYNISKINQIEELSISFCENLGDSVLSTLLNINVKQLKKLSLRKIRLETSSLIDHFFINNKLNSLEKLDLFDNIHITNISLYSLSSSKNLISIDLSWSIKISDEGVYFLLTNCLFLRNCLFVGCKNLTDSLLLLVMDLYDGLYKNLHTQSLSDVITNIYENNKKLSAFESLALCDFTKCDLINDDVLYNITSIFKQLKFINYYGEIVE